MTERYSKLRKVIRAVRSSPQRCQQWYQIISPTKVVAVIHMLILDVKTRWSSTHQMMSTFARLCCVPTGLTLLERSRSQIPHCYQSIYRRQWRPSWRRAYCTGLERNQSGVGLAASVPFGYQPDVYNVAPAPRTQYSTTFKIH